MTALACSGVNGGRRHPHFALWVARFGSFLLIPLSRVGYLAAALARVAASVGFAARKLPRKAASALIALATPILLWVPINWAADCVHLGLTAEFGAYTGRAGYTDRPSGQGQALSDPMAI